MATALETTNPSLAVVAHHSWIRNREVVGSAGQRAAVDPSTGEGFAQASLLGRDQVGAAVEAAREAFPAWANTPGVRLVSGDYRGSGSVIS